MKERSKRGRRRKPSRFRYIAWTFQFLFLGLALAVVALGAGALYQVSQRLPTIEELGLSAAATRIYSADGVLLARIYRENRDYIHLKDIPQNLQDATVAVEDDRFYSHGGVDVRGIGRAIVSNVKGGSRGQGGSTITQQLARNAYNLGKEKTYTRKLQEAVVALRLERKYSKKEILEGYLNEVYYGAKAYGVQAASMQYFGKPARKLTLAEAALLAGLPQRPTDFNPYKNISASRTRRNVVLGRMAELGYISREEMEKARKEPIRLAYKKQHEANDWKAPYFVDYVVQQLEARYGSEIVYRGGLVVHTSLLYSMQKAGEQAVRAGVEQAARRGFVNSKAQAALSCVDPHSGYIRAMVGGKDWNQSQFNRATNNKRQPGSTFKTFVYIAALNEGWNQYRTVSDSPKSWKQANGKMWTPGNYDGRFRGTISLRSAVANSVNMVAIKTADAVGIQKAIDVARKLGLEGPLPPYLATSIGAGGASTLEMAGAYGALAVKGQFIKPIAIIEVKDRDGNVMERVTPKAKQVVKPAVSNEMAQMLRAVVTEGTGRSVGVVPEAFGKTGTTQDDRDAWFVGFTPQLATAVWMGYDDYSPMRHAYGGTACGPIWVRFMQDALKLNPKKRPDFTNTAPPETRGETERVEVEPGRDGVVRLRICTQSGEIATNRCPSWRTRSFSPEEAPTSVCGQHPGQALSEPRRAETGRARDQAASAERADPVVREARREATEAPARTVAMEMADEPVLPRQTAPEPPVSAPVRPARQMAAPAPSPQAQIMTLCAETGMRATAACPRTITRSITTARPLPACNVH